MGSWDFDLASGEWFWDEGQSRIFGVDHATFVPTLERVRQALHAEDVEAIRQAFGALRPDRESCKVEFRIVRPTGEVRWCAAAAFASFDASGSLLRLSGVITDITDQKEAADHQTMLAHEVDHRAKNALAVVQAIVRMAKRDNIDDYAAAVEGRIGALAKTHELLSRSKWEGADILRLVLDELEPYRTDGDQRITILGPPLVLGPEQAQLVAMAIHELATNAAKYGSLSVEAGRVDVSWSTFDGVLSLIWDESGGPSTLPPTKTGFGTKIISSLGKSHGGRTEFNWRPTGLSFKLELRYQKNSSSPDRTVKTTNADEVGSSRLLLVEDELVVGMFMQELLETIGYRPTDPVGRLSDAMEMATKEQFDGAVLDMNLNGEIVYPLADLLTRQRVPFLFVTGYAQRSVDPRFAAVPLLQKPVLPEELADALENILGFRPTKTSRSMTAAK
jgi:two-component sensor histidine kinase/CheY-like chemotaxis protein